MAWGTILAAMLALALEIFKLVREVRQDKKEENIELTKKRTEVIQSIARGIVDGDEPRIVMGFDKLRELRRI